MGEYIERTCYDYNKETSKRTSRHMLYGGTSRACSLVRHCKGNKKFCSATRTKLLAITLGQLHAQAKEGKQ